MSCVGFLAAAGVWLAAAPGEAQARTRRVPERYATIQAAVDAADAGDVIDVGPGRHCGATIDRPVRLRGDGRAVIVGCADGPVLANGVRAGFRLPGADGASAASGTQIEGFVFDGRGVSAANLDPLGVAIIATFANDVRVERNRVLGTVQGITNTGGDRWVIAHNVIDDLGVFDCTRRAVRRRRRHRHPARRPPRPTADRSATSSPATSSAGRSPTASACSRWSACSCSPPTARW